MMNRELCFVVLSVLALGLPTNANQDQPRVGDLVDLVNPFIGTGGHGHTFPGATRPFGMVQLSPDTRLTGWDGCSGYHNSDDVIFGFSHTHLSGTGVSDYGDILFMPAVGPVQMVNGSRGEDEAPDPEAGYASRFRKQTERASPGYYSVHLDDPDIDVELTATARTGFHRYGFQAGEENHIVVDLSHRDTVLESRLRIVGDREIEGMRRSSAWARDQRVFFVARFSRPFSSYGLLLDEVLQEQQDDVSGENVKGFFRFPAAEARDVLIQVGLSAVDIEGARKNLEAEQLPWNFDAARALASAEWQRSLSKIEVEGGTAEQRHIFYTALYHSMIAPNLFSDVDGRTRGMGGEIHSPGHDVYSVFSLWDTFRATHPLFTLIERERTAVFMKTFLHQFRSGGKLPIWELAGNYTGCMIGYHAIPVIADAYLKGIRGFDAEALFGAMRVSAESEVLGLDAYQELGYIPADREAESVSKTLEYAYDDWCIARMAEALGKDDFVSVYDRRAQAYRHLYDPETGFLRPRANGGWTAPFDPREVNFHFTEANAWQYSLFVPHDLSGLAQLMGGDAGLVARLDGLFGANSSTTGRNQADITGLIGQYAHGNEPSHHVAYLYNFAGQPWKTQRRVHQILTELYRDQPDGLSGNEDCGQMSSWYVLSALGLYPVCPGSNEYVIGTPLFDRATLNFEDGKTFTIEARRKNDGDFYIQTAQLDGHDYPRGYVTHEAIVSGGALMFELGGSPNESWASAPEHRPHSAIDGVRATAVPHIQSPKSVFRKTLTVSIEHLDPAASIRYTLDGSTPDAESELYAGAFTLDQSTEVRAMALHADLPPSAVVVARFKKLDHNWAITVDTPYSTQYAASGNAALIDGRRGVHDFRVGSWQGWLGERMQVTIDLGRETEINRVGVGFLQDVRSWIWLPETLEIHTSVDGDRFELAARVEHDVAEDDYEATIRVLRASLGGKTARFVRLVTSKLDEIPAWHPGRGNAAWIFADEVLID